MAVIEEISRIPRQRVAPNVPAAPIRRAVPAGATVLLADLVAGLFATALLSLFALPVAGHAAVLLPLTWCVAAWLLGAYEERALSSGPLELRSAAMTALALLATAGVLAQLAVPGLDSRLVLLALPAVIGTVALGRTASRTRWLRRYRPGGAPRRVVAVGSATAVTRFLRAIRERRDESLRVVGACVPGGHDASALVRAGVPFVADFADVASTVDVTSAECVVVLEGGGVDAEELRRLSWRLGRMSVPVAVAPLWDVAQHRISIRPAGNVTLVEVGVPRLSGPRVVVMDALGRLLAGLALIGLFPLLLAIAVAVKLGDGGPVFFRQLRTGKDGRRFGMLKFRTMVPNAEQLKDQLRSSNQYGAGTLFKMRDDPRVTRVGSVLRKYSLDELPQLINVLLGQMSLVGPRPTATPPHEMPEDYRRRTLVKPGLTGLWQVSGRSDLAWEEAVRLDLTYVENRSLLLDLGIMTRTLQSVLHADGAY